jgi:hypothetical protein
MLTKEDTADEFGITDADVAEWDAEVAEYLACRKADSKAIRPWEEVKQRLKERAEQYRKELKTKA